MPRVSLSITGFGPDSCVRQQPEKKIPSFLFFPGLVAFVVFLIIAFLLSRRRGWGGRWGGGGGFLPGHDPGQYDESRDVMAAMAAAVSEVTIRATVDLEDSVEAIREAAALRATGHDGTTAERNRSSGCTKHTGTSWCP